MKATETQLLDEDQAVELLAFLITSARIQLDEPASYGSMRLLTAASRLSSFMAAKASPGTQAFLGSFMAEITAADEHTADGGRYAVALDGLCRGIAGHLVDRSGLEAGPK